MGASKIRKQNGFLTARREVSFLGLLALPEDNAITGSWEAVTERNQLESTN
ncbi:hypothetical protein [Actinomadura livida]|uniref:Uncharacterized protein n=1 Tax=Actinomadura livida TaxID=79909 RepID=A0A7W7ICW5_9ACTN|nr:MULTISPECIES: hypothetical protein [Actinomadura]MBB4774691.1 hypothetical protein [Actinomadura catellatispora]